MRLMGTNINFSTAFHPQTDGQTEKQINSVEQLLRSYCTEQPHTWFEYLAQVELALNAFPSTVTQVAPHKVVYGSDVNLPIDVAVDSNVTQAAHTLESMQKCWSKVRQHLENNARTMQLYFNKHRKDLQFKVGEYVLLDTRNLQLP